MWEFRNRNVSRVHSDDRVQTFIFTRSISTFLTLSRRYETHHSLSEVLTFHRFRNIISRVDIVLRRVYRNIFYVVMNTIHSTGIFYTTLCYEACHVILVPTIHIPLFRECFRIVVWIYTRFRAAIIIKVYCLTLARTNTIRCSYCTGTYTWYYILLLDDR